MTSDPSFQLSQNASFQVEEHHNRRRPSLRSIKREAKSVLGAKSLETSLRFFLSQQ